jgi:hypothetical protein
MYLQEPTTDSPQGASAGDYLREKWAAFESLSPQIIDLQHRAALAKQAYESQGNTLQADAAMLLIQQLAKLQQIHHSVVTWAESAAGAVGLGAIQIPLGVAGVSLAALLVAWVFRKYAAQERALELLESGVLTPEQFRQLDILDPPGIGGDVASIAGGIGKWVLFIILGFALLEATKQGQFFKNPPLVLFGNPPGPMSEDVAFIGYQHNEDGEWYIHEFAGGVEMDALPDGSIAIHHPEKEIWKEF